MLNELIKQVQDRVLPAEVSDWIERRYPENQALMSLTEGEHILDWIAARSPKKLAKMTWAEALSSAEKWSKAEQKKGAHIKETKTDTEIFMKVGEYNIVQLVGENAFKREGHLMSHCVASYYGKTGMKIYSLRDIDNNPHATFEVTGDDQVQQVKGKGNGAIHPNYIDAVVQFLEKLGMEVRDSEMANLGYLNLEKFTKHLSKDTEKKLFRKKYWNQKDKLIDKDGDEFASLDFLDSKPLVTETVTGLKVNFELPKFIKLSLEFLFKQNKAQDKGDYSKLAASGHSSKLAASGHSSKLAASGHYSKLAASGDSSKLAASGDSSQLAASGDYSKLAASGDSSQLAASGHYSKLAASGHYSKLAASGHYSQLAASGDYSKLAASGDSSQLAASGDYSKLAASGDSSQLAASGHYSKLAASGHYSKLAASGDSSKLAASGDSSQLAMEGTDSVGAAIGIQNKIKGKKGCWITLAEYSFITEKWFPVCVRSAQIDGEILKEDTWYKLEKGEFVEFKN